MIGQGCNLIEERRTIIMYFYVYLGEGIARQDWMDSFHLEYVGLVDITSHDGASYRSFQLCFFLSFFLSHSLISSHSPSPSRLRIYHLLPTRNPLQIPEQQIRKIIPILGRHPRNMRRDEHIRRLPQRMSLGQRLRLRHVQRSTPNLATLQRLH